MQATARRSRSSQFPSRPPRAETATPLRPPLRNERPTVTSPSRRRAIESWRWAHEDCTRWNGDRAGSGGGRAHELPACGCAIPGRGRAAAAGRSSGRAPATRGAVAACDRAARADRRSACGAAAPSGRRRVPEAGRRRPRGSAARRDPGRAGHIAASGGATRYRRLGRRGRGAGLCPGGSIGAHVARRGGRARGARPIRFLAGATVPRGRSGGEARPALRPGRLTPWGVASCRARVQYARAGGFMETPLTPLEFGRRARRLYPEREAVVDGALRLTYSQLFDRCDRWSSALQRLGVKRGDRVAYIAPNTHAQLESFYAVPQIGAVLVPINYRLTADDFAYIVEHSGATVVCVHSDYLVAVDSIRARLPKVRHWIALEGTLPGWLDYERALREAQPAFERVAVAETDLLTINYTSGTTARPKGVMITHRNAWVNSVGTLVHLDLRVGDRYLWTLPMFHANGWAFTWTVTAAAAAHVCMRKVDAAQIYALVNRERVTHLRAAPTVLIGIANGAEPERRQ